MKKLFLIGLAALTLSACTDEEIFLTGVAVVACAATECLDGIGTGGGGSSYVSEVQYRGLDRYDDDDDWDQFSNGQWRCREISTGLFLPDWRCSDNLYIDQWW